MNQSVKKSNNYKNFIKSNYLLILTLPVLDSLKVEKLVEDCF